MQSKYGNDSMNKRKGSNCLRSFLDIPVKTHKEIDWLANQVDQESTHAYNPTES
jgi:hypothetical protein